MTPEKTSPLPIKGRLFSWKVGFLPQPQQKQNLPHEKRHDNSRAGNNHIVTSTKSGNKVRDM
jgi:hypothetical protein